MKTIKEIDNMRTYQLKPMTPHRPPGFEGLPYGFRVKIIGRPDTSGRVRVRDLSGRVLGLVSLRDLEIL